MATISPGWTAKLKSRNSTTSPEPARLATARYTFDRPSTRTIAGSGVLLITQRLRGHDSCSARARIKGRDHAYTKRDRAYDDSIDHPRREGQVVDGIDLRVQVD